ncbi:MAG: PspC domain-containing protein [Propionibacteriaceae bacterium]|jgi:phage shock protein PspC (stress-responsive transcriptional regulator)|nr:PspC domain-containing protein [Propionibacteriaceae bacterium]
MPTRQLTRSRTNRVFGGVAGGIAEFTGFDLNIVRLVTAAVVVFTGGVGFVLYVLAWILLPLQGSSTSGLTTIIDAFKTNKPNGGDPHPGDYR